MSTTIFQSTRILPLTLPAVGFCLGGCDLVKDIPAGTGYAAKNICSDYFTSHLDLSDVKKTSGGACCRTLAHALEHPGG